VLRFYRNPSWVIIPTPSCQFLRTNYTCTRFTSRIPISATLDPHNFLWLGSFAPYFRKVLDTHKYRKELKPRRSHIVFSFAQSFLPLGAEHFIVTVECAGILPCSTAVETITHIEKTWERGQVCHPNTRDPSQHKPLTLQTLINGVLRCCST
jgi:hypothetical protein